METNLQTDISIEDICNGFLYSELEGKGLFGLSGKLIIPCCVFLFVLLSYWFLS